MRVLKRHGRWNRLGRQEDTAHSSVSNLWLIYRPLIAVPVAWLAQGNVISLVEARGSRFHQVIMNRFINHKR